MTRRVTAALFIGGPYHKQLVEVPFTDGKAPPSWDLPDPQPVADSVCMPTVGGEIKAVPTFMIAHYILYDTFPVKYIHEKEIKKEARSGSGSNRR